MDQVSNASAVQLVPDFPFKLVLESKFDALGVDDFIQEKYHYSLYFVVTYLVSVGCGQTLMKHRKPMGLERLLCLWNGFLALMSLAGGLRTVPELIHSLANFGLDHTICDARYYNDSTVMACWCQVIVLSKVIELFDTFFVVLRKQKLIFLHWFHHSTVLVFTWVIAKDRCAVSRWYMSMNYCIHAAMYTYFALRAMKVRVPRCVAVSITSAQILQMIVGLFISVLGFLAWYSGNKCDMSGRVAVFGVTLYSFYFILFVQFFVNSYVLPRYRKVAKAE